MKKTIILLIIFTCVARVYAQREGFEHYFLPSEFAVGAGARALAMGGAFIAIADDATAASWNPAGLAQLLSKEISFSYFPYQEIHGYSPSIYRISNNPSSFLSETAFSPIATGRDINFLSFAYPVITSKRNYVLLFHYQRALSFSFRHYLISPILGSRAFSDKIENYKESWDGDVAGGFDIAAFSFATSLTSNLKLGISINKWFNNYQGNDSASHYGSIYEKNKIYPYSFSEIDEDSFKISGLNFNMGLLLNIKNISFGLVFKTPFNAKLSYYENIFEAEIQNNTFKEDRHLYQGEANVDWPYTIGFGFAIRFSNAYLISSDYTKTNWSDAIIHNYIDDNNPQGNPIYYPTLQPIKPNQQGDSEQIRFGFERVFFIKNILLPLRIGFFLDKQIFYDSTMQKPYFKGLTLGTSVGYERLTFDISYIYEFGEYSSILNTRPFNWVKFHSTKYVTSFIIHF